MPTLPLCSFPPKEGQVGGKKSGPMAVPSELQVMSPTEQDIRQGRMNAEIETVAAEFRFGPFDIKIVKNDETTNVAEQMPQASNPARSSSAAATNPGQVLPASSFSEDESSSYGPLSMYDDSIYDCPAASRARRFLL